MTDRYYTLRNYSSIFAVMHGYTCSNVATYSYVLTALGYVSQNFRIKIFHLAFSCWPCYVDELIMGYIIIIIYTNVYKNLLEYIIMYQS